MPSNNVKGSASCRCGVKRPRLARPDYSPVTSSGRASSSSRAESASRLTTCHKKYEEARASAVTTSAVLTAVPVAVRSCRGGRVVVSRLALTGEAVRLRHVTPHRGRDGLRRMALPARNAARARMHLWGRGGKRHRGAAYRAAEFGACFDASRIGGEAASPLGPVERAVAGCRGERTLPVEIAPLAGERGAAEPLLQRLDVIRHAPAVRGIVLP